MKNYPKISIIIPSYNMVGYIGQTLDSIVAQNYPNLEVIVRDGGSTDKTAYVIEKYAKKHKYIQWLSKKDRGQLDAINEGLSLATGDILTYINADDVYEKDALKSVGEYFSKHPDTLWLAGRGRVVNKNGKEISSLVTAYKNLLLTINNYQLLLIVNYLMQPSVFLSRKAYLNYGPFSGNEKFVMEYDLWLKLGKIKMPTVLSKILSSFRMSGENISSTQFNKLLIDDLRLVKKHTANPTILLLHQLHNFGRKIVVKSI